jgi:hypothetical protein
MFAAHAAGELRALQASGVFVIVVPSDRVHGAEVERLPLPVRTAI